MNSLNYSSFEASKRLADAGIVLETDHYWRPIYERIGLTKIRISGYTLATYLKNRKITGAIPAPSMAEVWRELPSYLTISGCGCVLGAFRMRDDLSVVVYDWHGEWLMHTRNTNPTDALIDLLIWVRREKL